MAILNFRILILILGNCDMIYYCWYNIVFCCFVLQQPQISSCVETAASDLQFPVVVTGGRMKPVIEPITVNLTWQRRYGKHLQWVSDT